VKPKVYTWLSRRRIDIDLEVHNGIRGCDLRGGSLQEEATSDEPRGEKEQGGDEREVVQTGRNWGSARILNDTLIVPRSMKAYVKRSRGSIQAYSHRKDWTKNGRRRQSVGNTWGS